MDWTTTRGSSHVGCVVQAIVNNLAPLLFAVLSSRYGIGLALDDLWACEQRHRHFGFAPGRPFC